jgi:hypothetical protein
MVDKLNSNSLPHEIYLKSLSKPTVEEADNYLNTELRAYKIKIYDDFLSGVMSKAELLRLLSLPGEKG